jgi:hypothetical protein
MDNIGLDLHQRESQLRILSDAGELLEQRIATTCERFTAASTSTRSGSRMRSAASTGGATEKCYPCPWTVLSPMSLTAQRRQKRLEPLPKIPQRGRRRFSFGPFGSLQHCPDIRWREAKRLVG